MPQATQKTGRSLAHVLFLSAALSLLSVLVRKERRQLVLTARDRRKKVRVAPQKDRREPRVRDALLRGRRAVRGRGERSRAADRPGGRFCRHGGHDHDHHHHDHQFGYGGSHNGSERPDRRPTSSRLRPSSLPPPSRSRRRWGRRASDRATSSAREPVSGRHGLEHERRRRPLDAQGAAPCRAPEAGRRGRPHTRGRAAPRWFPPVSSARRFRLWSRR